MKIIFIDETDRQANATIHKFFCICGLIIDESELITTTNELEEIKIKYGLSNLKDSRKNGLDEARKVSITTEIFNCLTRHKVEVIGIILGDFSMSSDLPKDAIYMGAMSFLMERFTLGLIKSKSCGLVVFDCIGKSIEKVLRQKFYKYIQTESVKMFWKEKPEGVMKDYINPTLLFADDEECILIQVVDLIAVSLNNAIFNITQQKSNITVKDLHLYNKFLKIYWPIFVRNYKGDIEGCGIKKWD